MSKITDNEIDKIADKLLEKLKGDNRDTNKFKETEMMLSGYEGFKKSIELNNIKIKEIEQFGLKENPKTKNITEAVQGGLKKYGGIPEQEIERIEHLKSENAKLEKLIIRTDNALVHIENDHYYEIIKLRYFENETIESIALKLDINEKTVRKYKNRLIQKLQYYIFPEQLLN